MAETIETSQDQIKVYLVDSYVNARTHVEIKDPIDLSAALTLTLVFRSPAGLSKSLTLTADPDQTTNKGYASATWSADSLAAGRYWCQVQYKDSANAWHYSDSFSLNVGTKLVA